MILVIAVMIAVTAPAVVIARAQGTTMVRAKGWEVSGGWVPASWLFIGHPPVSACMCRVFAGYGSDLVGDEEDRKMLDGLNEIQREEILTQRREKRMQLKEIQQVWLGANEHLRFNTRTRVPGTLSLFFEVPRVHVSRFCAKEVAVVRAARACALRVHPFIPYVCLATVQLKKTLQSTKQANAAKLRKRGVPAAGKARAKAAAAGRAKAAKPKSPGSPKNPAGRGGRSGGAPAMATKDDRDGDVSDHASDDDADSLGGLSDGDSEDVGYGERRSSRLRSAVAKRPARARRGVSPSSDSDGRPSDGRGRGGSSGSEVTYHTEDSDLEGSGPAESSSEDEADKRLEADLGPLSLEHIHSCFFSRASLLKYVDEPYFKDMVTGSFVRVVSKASVGVKDVRYNLAQVCTAATLVPVLSSRGVGVCASSVCGYR
jgi:hypothetical protein